MILLLIVSFLGYGHFFSLRSKLPPGTSIFLGIASLIPVLYLAGFSSLLREFSFAIFGGGLALTLYFSIADYQSRRFQFLGFVRSDSAVVFCVYTVFTYFSFADSWFLRWDEISHWGLVLKEMLLHKRNLQFGDVSYHKLYPPGAALFQYYFSEILGPREGNAYCSQAVLMLVPILQLLELRPPNRQLGRALFLFAFLLVFVFFYGWKMIYVDASVSLFFAGALLFYLINKPRRPHTLLWLLPIFVTAGMIKFIGNLLIIMTLIVIAIDLISDNWAAIATAAKSNSNFFLKVAVRYVTVFGVLYWLPKFAQLIWANRDSRIFLQPVVYSERPPITIENVVSVFTQNGLAPYQISLIHKFNDAFVTWNIVQQANPRFVGSAILFVGILCVLAFISIFRAREDRKTVAITQTVLSIGFVFYVFGLLVLYLFRFNEFEGTALASYDRYMNIFINAWLIVAVLLCAKNLSRRWSAAVMIGLFVFIFQFLSWKQFDSNFFHNSPPPGVRETLQRALKPVTEAAPFDSKVYVVWQKTTGFELYIMRFELAPRRTNMECWGLGKPWSKEDIWTCDKSVEDFKSALEKFDFFFLGFTDDDFWNKYASIFPKEIDPKAHSFYKIVRDPELRLQPLN